MLKEAFLIIIFIKCSLCAEYEVINDKITLENVNRTIILKSQIAKIYNIIDIKNDGSSVVDYVVYCLEEPKIDPAYLIALTMSEIRLVLELIATKIQTNQDKKCWKILLDNGLIYGDTVTIQVNEYWTNVITPFPKYITQYENQYVIYQGNAVFYSAYKIKNMITTVNVNTNNIEAYTEINPTTYKNGKITYGPYFNLTEFSSVEFDVHYMKNSPFLVVQNLEQIITVSHWGSISVEQRTELRHNGAKLKGPFSKLDYQATPRNSSPSIPSYIMSLPASATGIYYYDDVGNISTSFPQATENEVFLTVQPRYPLLGGWKTKHVIGYSLPCYEYLYHLEDHYLLKMRIIDYVYSEMVVEKLTTKIMLPNGVYDIRLITPYPVKKSEDDLSYTTVLNHSYFDKNGHSVITLTKENLIYHHVHDFYLEYKFQSIQILQKPILIILVLYSLFLIAIIYINLDFSIHKNIINYPNLITKLCKKLKMHQDKRFSLYHIYDNELSKLKISKDVNSFYWSMKSVNNEFKTETNIISHICERLMTIKDLCEKLQNLQHFDKLLMEQYLEHQKFCTDMITSGKIVRHVLREAENMFFIKRNALLGILNQTYKSID